MTDEQAQVPGDGPVPKRPDEDIEQPLEPGDGDDEQPMTTITIDEPTLIVPKET